jgi:hypothetical protein
MQGVYCGNRPMRISNVTFEAEGDTCANYQTICEFWEQPKDLHQMRERQLDIADMNLDDGYLEPFFEDLGKERIMWKYAAQREQVQEEGDAAVGIDQSF